MIVRLAAIALGVVVFCFAGRADAANYPFTSTSPGYSQGGENSATIDGDGQCQITAGYKIITVTPQGEIKVKIDPSEYVLEDGKNHPVVRFRKGLPKGVKIVNGGETPNKPKGGNSHNFKMSLKKV